MSLHLHLDLSAGAAGDMFVAAIVDAGLIQADEIRRVAASLGLPGVEVQLFGDSRGGVRGTRLRVLRNGKPVEEIEGSQPTAEAKHGHSNERRKQDAGHEHGHDRRQKNDSHSHGTGHGHSHSHGHSHGHSHEHGHRRLTEIVQVFERAHLPESVKREAARLATRLAEAESKIHGVPVAEVYLHEVSADDSIVDLALSAWCMERLRQGGLTRVTATSINVGHGTVDVAHGRLPVPPPATTELLLGRPTYAAGLPGERCTPTGALLISAFVDEHRPQPPMRLLASGYGLGTKNFADGPNALRILAGEPERNGAQSGVVLIEADVDDAPGEWVGYARERLLVSGALDVVLIPTSMKKGRPGQLLRVLAPASREETLVDVIFRETTTLGVRAHDLRRHECEREIVTVETRWGSVPVKVGKRHGNVMNVAAEYEACAELARQNGVPLKDVVREAEEKAKG